MLLHLIYLQVVESDRIHFVRFACPIPPRAITLAGMVQKVSETAGTDRKSRGPKSEKPLEIDLLALETSHIVEAAVPPQGLEP